MRVLPFTPAKAIASLCALAVLALPAVAQNRTEYQIKAAYLYNFAKFAKWSPEAGVAPNFSICVLGENPFGRTLETTVAGEKLDGKEILARHIKTPAEATGCHIVYVSRSEQARLAVLLPELAKHHALTVSDAPRFCERGGVIGFVMDGERVRFEVNLGAAHSSGLALSSELLKVALHVKNAPAKEPR